MATTVRPIPPRVPFVDLRTGYITREWFVWLTRVSGVINSALGPGGGGDGGGSDIGGSEAAPPALTFDDLLAALGPQLHALEQAPPTVPPMARQEQDATSNSSERLAALEAAVAAMTKTLNSMQQGIET